MSRRLAILVTFVGALLIVGSTAYVVLSGDRDAGDVAAVEAEIRSALAEADDPSSAPVPITSSDQSEGSAGVEERGDEKPPEYEPPTLVIEPGPQPVGLRIEGLEVDAPVGAYGVNRRTGEMDVPDNVTEVGWYRFGAAPGDAGSAVLAAHVDLASQGPGVFFDLRRIDPGMLVVVEMDDGSERFFRVRARKTYDKDELPLDVIFAKEGPPVLTLITCGGGFNRNVGSYDSNVVVYAVPVDGPDDQGRTTT
jgi:sortase (surface protein transpeptidase)